jgi:hypothetical protein
VYWAVRGLAHGAARSRESSRLVAGGLSHPALAGRGFQVTVALVPHGEGGVLVGGQGVMAGRREVQARVAGLLVADLHDLILPAAETLDAPRLNLAGPPACSAVLCRSSGPGATADRLGSGESA